MKLYLKILQYIIITVFMGIIILPMVNEQFNIFEEIEGNENRKKAEKPVFKINNIDSYTKKYDTYYTDNFNLRQNFVSAISQFDLQLFKISPVPKRAIIGKHGWIYATKSKNNYKGANLFTQNELNQLNTELENRTIWAKEKGIEYYIAIVPNKMNIYPEYLPNHIIHISDSTRYDQVISLDSNKHINIIDIRRNLLEHKDDGYKLYQRTDDHWNDLGAYYGYQEIMERLNQSFPELEPFPISDYNIINIEKSGNLASIINADNVLKENFIKLTEKNPINAVDGENKGYSESFSIKSKSNIEIIKKNDEGINLKCLIIRDSFGAFLVHFFQENFRDIIVLHDGWQYLMHENILEAEKPDIVLIIVLETEIHKLLIATPEKTVDSFYKTLTSDPQKVLNTKKKAIERNISVDIMTKRLAMWLFMNSKKKGEYVKKTLMFYEFQYEVDQNYRVQAEQYAFENQIPIETAIKTLSKKAYNSGKEYNN